MNAKALILPLFLCATLSGIYFLPQVGKVAASAVSMDLPPAMGTWIFKGLSPSPEEIGTLAPDTRFSKALCLAARPGEFDKDGYTVLDRIDLSIVLSGADVNNSIHRPERCMPAQGHNIVSSRNETIELQNGRNFPAKRLLSIQSIPKTEERKDFYKLNCVTYYFFVGHDCVTNDHLGRTFIDMKDRLVRGMDQRWAYVSVSSWYGNIPFIEAEITEKEADTKIRDFITNLAQRQIDWSQIKVVDN